MHDAPGPVPQSRIAALSPHNLTRDESPILEAITRQIDHLRNLATFRLSGNAYWNKMMEHPDPVIAVAAAIHLVESETFSVDSLENFFELCTHPAIAQIAVRHFIRDHEFDHAAHVVSITSERKSEFLLNANHLIDEVQAVYSDDHTALMDIELQKFLIDGSIHRIRIMSLLARRAGGLSQAVTQYVREALIFPQDPVPLLRLIRVLRAHGQNEVFGHLAQIAVATSAPKTIQVWIEAEQDHFEGRCEQAAGKMSLLDLSDLPDDWQSEAMHRLAIFTEASGNIDRAITQFRKLKSFQSKSNAAEHARHDCEILKNLKKQFQTSSNLPDHRRDCVILTGFARSGTTYLLSKLSEHPEIEAFDEVPSFISALMASNKDTSISQLTRMRRAYYQELDRRRKKTDALCLIDKAPMIAGNAEILSSLFPDRRYVFLIRHPMDVIISCYRQFFSLNASTLPFLDLDECCDAYANSMSEWFSVYSLEDRNVHYVKYEALLDNRNDVLNGIFHFLDRDPIKISDRRNLLMNNVPALSPMHHQVNSGDMFKPTSRRENYVHLFQKQSVQKLEFWIKHFQYNLNYKDVGQ